MANLKLITEPTVWPVSLDEAKGHLRVEHDADDARIDRLIQVATQQIEEAAGIALLPQTWEWALDAFPADGILRVPRPPLTSITSITTYSPSNVSAVVSAATYSVDTWSAPGRVSLVSGYAWPTDLRTVAAVVVRFVAGYASAIAVPAPLREAVLHQLEALYDESPEAQTRATELLTPYRQLGVA